MEDTAHKAIAIVGVGAVLPDAADARRFWANIEGGRYSISEVQSDHWNADLYYDPDPKAPDKTYSKIGGWCRDWDWNPLKWRLPVPPKVSDSMDRGQKWAVMSTREVLDDYGYPGRPLDPDRTAVIMGTAMGGDMQLLTAARIFFPEYSDELSRAPSFASLSQSLRDSIVEELFQGIGKRLPPISEDTMPGELANIVAGRIAALFNFRGPNYITDAACASAMAAISTAAEGLIEHDYDAVITGGIDANMSASTFTKFCKIGALSATGTRPYAEGADGFVMGEGSAVFLLKRLADAERDQDRVYAVLRGIGGSSDGKGKGITAPNPVGQRLAIERAWQNAGVSPATVTMIEGHGTSTRVGDKVEAGVLGEVFGGFDLPVGSVALGSVKSNIGHLKGAAGAAGILKATLALHHKTLPPSLNFERPSPTIDFSSSPLRVNTTLRPWDETRDGVRRAGVSAFGFGGTNFHAVLEEYIPGRIPANGRRAVSVPAGNGSSGGVQAQAKAPLRGALVIGGDSEHVIAARLKEVLRDGEAGKLPPPSAPRESDLRAAVRLAIDYADLAELETKGGRVLKALESSNPAMWRALRAQGVFLGRGPAPKVAFLYTGQGSQYVNMLQGLRRSEPIVAEVFRRADAVMTPLLDGRPLSDYIFIDGDDPDKVRQAERDLRQTAITQPAVLATDASMTALLAAYGITPDMVMGHSLGEYGALVAAGALPFEDALEAVSARGREMTNVAMEDNGAMAAVFGPIAEIQRTLDDIDGYVVVANINSNSQAVVGGATDAVKAAAQAFEKRGFQAIPLPVSHAFHTSIVAPASAPLRDVLKRLRLQSPELPLVANTNGEFYPTGPDVKEQMLDILAEQISSPVQFIKGLNTLYEAGARVFVEVGPKKALHGFVEDVLGHKDDVSALFTNHPKLGDVASFNQALCGLYAAGYGVGQSESQVAVVPDRSEQRAAPVVPAAAPYQVAAPAAPVAPAPAAPAAAGAAGAGLDSGGYVQLGKLFADFMQRGLEVYSGQGVQPQAQSIGGSVTISGAGLGLPGTERVFSDDNVARVLRGDQLIDAIPMKHRRQILDKNIVRLVKSDAGARFEPIDHAADVIKLAGRAGALDLVEDFGFPKDRLPALDIVTQLAIGAGLDALRDAGIPLVLRYKTTTRGTKLPDRWMLPDQMREDTGVVFASAFPGYGALIDDVGHYHRDKGRRERLSELEQLRERMQQAGSDQLVVTEIERRIAELQSEIKTDGYTFDRRFVFKVLAMGHSQFAEYIGARGPNTHVNAACASTTHAVSVAEDWIRSGRCRRVIVLSADDVTSDTMLEWFGAGFLITGAAATDELVEDAAVPFDRRRHGMLLGMGAAAVVVETAEAVAERGVRPICEVLSTVTSNSAFHGTRLDISHISGLMEELLAKAERRFGIDRHAIAAQTMFMSHETYTPARGGSAQAEIQALRDTFGAAADQIVIANTKGMTGHAMGAGMEDVVAIKALETGQVPPVANHKESDPELGTLNLSRGGAYPLQYALRLGAGFGSQIALSLVRWIPTADGRRPAPQQLGFESRLTDPARHQQWAASVSGHPGAQLEVVKRTLRFKDQGPPTVQPAPAPVRPDLAHATAMAPAAATTQAPAPVVTPPVAAAPRAPVVTPPAAAAPAVVTAPPVQQPAAPAKQVVDRVAEAVLKIVAGQTGYDRDMLDVELDLEADLGIDTVKQAETFAAVREAYDIPRQESMQLRDFPTLKHVIQFVYDNRPDLAGMKAEEERAAAPPAPRGPVVDQVANAVLKIVSDQTGYPQDMLDLELDLEADLGVDTVKQAETFASVREAYDIPRQDNMQLRNFPTLKHVIQFVYDHRPDLAAMLAEARGPATAAAPAVTASQAPATAAATAAAPVAADGVQAKVLEIVSDQTGYPQDMLDLELDLEADLGVDTVKQAETFAAVREAYDIPRQESMQLRDFPTLKHVIQFVYDNRPDLAPAAGAPTAAAPVASAAPAASAPAPASAADGVQSKVLEIVAEQTGYPTDMLDLELDLEADLGVDTVKQAETFAAVREAYDIPRQENMQLRDFPTLKHVIQFVYDNRPDLAPSTGGSAAHAPAAEAPQADASDGVQATVLGIVADQTGYPTDMLDPALDLEADLGIDTVKQAETFAAVREAYDIPRQESMQLRDFPTLKHVIQFVYDHRPDLQGAAATAGGSASAAETAEVPAAAASILKGEMEAANAVPRRIPTAVLRPSLDVCKATGVQLDGNSRVIVKLDQEGVGKALVGRLEKLGVTVLPIEDSPSADELVARIEGWLAEGAIHGVYWLAGLDSEGSWSELDLSGFREAARVRVKLLYSTMRALYEAIDGAGTFLVSAVRLGGKHGYDEAGALSPLAGAVCGFTKTFKREKPAALVKVVDFEASRKTAALADLLIDETLSDPGVVEVGYQDDTRWTVGLSIEPPPAEQEALALNEDTVFVVTGAAGSIVSAIVADLAAASGGVFYLLDLTPEPDPQDQDVVRFLSDKEGLKRDLFERIKARGERATPKMVERELATLERQHSALAAIQAVQAAGGTAHYHSVNLLDGEAVAQVIEDLRQRHGKVDVLLHAAGLEISHLLPKKSPQEFDLVFDVKSDGWFNLLRSIGEMPLGATVAFSSIAGRFGNGGQTDYSAANDLLCKSGSSFRTTRPGTRAVTIDWTAWGGIGMAARGSIPLMMERAGIDMLAPEAGIPVVRRELVGGTNGELVVGQRLGLLLDEWDTTGGLDPTRLDSATPGPMANVVVGMGPNSGFTVESTLDPKQQPFLYDHQIDGTAVLPGVMGIEAFGELSTRLFPEWHIVAVEEVDFLAPFKFYRDEPRKVTVSANFRREGDEIVADCALTGTRELPNQPEPQIKTHFRAQVRLARSGPAEEAVAAPALALDGAVKPADIYQVYFHGPAYQVLEGAWRDGAGAVGLMPATLPKNHDPEQLPTVMDPRLIELCFQTAGIHEIGTTGRMGLPLHLDRVRAVRSAANANGRRLLAVVRPGADAGSYDAAVVDDEGNVYVRLEGYRTVQMPNGVDPDRQRPIKAAMCS